MTRTIKPRPLGLDAYLAFLAAAMMVALAAVMLVRGLWHGDIGSVIAGAVGLAAFGFLAAMTLGGLRRRLARYIELTPRGISSRFAWGRAVVEWDNIADVAQGGDRLRPGVHVALKDVESYINTVYGSPRGLERQFVRLFALIARLALWRRGAMGMPFTYLDDLRVLLWFNHRATASHLTFHARELDCGCDEFFNLVNLYWNDPEARPQLAREEG